MIVAHELSNCSVYNAVLHCLLLHCLNFEQPLIIDELADTFD